MNAQKSSALHTTWLVTKRFILIQRHMLVIIALKVLNIVNNLAVIFFQCTKWSNFFSVPSALKPLTEMEI